MKETTRREFLKSSALGIAAVTAGAIPLATEENRDGDEIKTWVTDDTRRFSPGDYLRWRSAGKVVPAIELYPEKKYQPVLGFGAAFTDSACYMFNQLTPCGCDCSRHHYKSLH